MHWHSSRERGSYRAWLRYGERGCVRVEFSWRTRLTGISFGFDDEDGWGGSLRLYFAGAYFHATVPRWARLKESREISLSFHNGGVWWKLWRDPMGGWSSRDPTRWRDSNFNFVDFFLGRSKCTVRTVEERDVIVPMPEKPYPAHAKLEEYTWKRPRWFSKQLLRVSIEVPNGIPHAGKGENSWDCGDDATFGITTRECRSIPEGVGVLVGACLRSRVKYGGWSDYSWSRPEAAE
jgi:hypothetical protein